MKLCTQCEKPSQFGLLVPLETKRVCSTCLPSVLSIWSIKTFDVDLKKWYHCDDPEFNNVPSTVVTNQQLVDLLIIMLRDIHNNPRYPRKDFLFNILQESRVGPAYSTQMLVFFLAWIANGEPSTNMSTVEGDMYNYFEPYSLEDYDTTLLFEHTQYFKVACMNILNHHYLTEEEKSEMRERTRKQG